MAYKLLIAVVLIVLFVVFLSSIVKYIPPSGGEAGRLGFVWGEAPRPSSPCTGELTVSSSGVDGGKCHLEASVVMRNCEGEGWYVFNGGSCSNEILVCNGNVGESESRWKCSWDADQGSYTFTLCVDTDAKASTSLTC